MNYKAVIWDFGGVITSSPFEAFNKFELDNNLPKDIIRTINSENPDDNAWAKFERNDIDINEFDTLFSKEADKKGFQISGKQVVKLLSGDIRKPMVDFLLSLKENYKLGCITNNIQNSKDDKVNHLNQASQVMKIFDHIIESSRVGLRKPDPKIYYMSCDALGVRPEECIYLDDLGINLKPARKIGMTTIKVIDPNEAIDEVKKYLQLK
jgi:putative hydrolase of the HAD superfamily|tara:strand:- start:4763 stop:5389 length:627 start_codon:yes stop_codon:yes gene_type:complete